jgi:hypothetical protein
MSIVVLIEAAVFVCYLTLAGLHGANLYVHYRAEHTKVKEANEVVITRPSPPSLRKE